MFSPNNLFEKLGFTDVQNQIIGHCISPMGRAIASKMSFVVNIDTISILLAQSEEFTRILVAGMAFPARDYHDLRPMLEKVRVEGSFLIEEELGRLKESVFIALQIRTFFDKNKEVYPQLADKAADYTVDKQILKEIAVIIDEKGKIRANASKELQKISTDISRVEGDIMRTMQRIYRQMSADGYTGDNQMSVRNGRMVIPLLAEHKRKMKGYTLDESATGQTVYVEPAEVLEQNNLLRSLEMERNREVRRILIELTNVLRPYFFQITGVNKLLGIMDFVRAKAIFGRSIDAVVPKITKEPKIKLSSARHPLLYQSLSAQSKAITTLDVNITQDYRILVISGPNSGGKSVALKTIGLLQLMFQHGIPVPVHHNSEMGIFKNIFADIGDNQSIESDLSTYTAHLTNLKYFAEFSDYHTLVLMDELGAGTDPKFGGPIAEAVLDTIHKKQAKGVITTHYSNLKLYANDTPGIENGAMLFDSSTLQPLYRLETGKPGSSYALEIAQKIGLPKIILDDALSKIGDEAQNYESLLVALEKEKRNAYMLKQILEEKERKLNLLINESSGQKVELNERKVKILDNARAEAKRIIDDTKILAMKTIKEVKDGKKKTIREVEKHLEPQLKSLEFMNMALQTEKPVPVNEADFGVNDWVQIPETNSVGQIINITKDEAMVALGDIRLKIKLKKLQKVKTPKESNTDNKTNNGQKMMQEQVHFYPQLDLRGKRGDNAMKELEKFTDRAIMLGFSNIKILHGKGDGILRKLTREYLNKIEQVKECVDEDDALGGNGITVVKF